MNHQILIKSYAAGKFISKNKLSSLELEHNSQLESIKFYSTQYGTEKDPKHIFRAA